MPSYIDELSLKLSAKDELSDKLKGTRKAISDTEKEMAKARAEFEKTGAPEAARQLKLLEQRWESLTREQAENRKANAANEAAMKRLRAEAEKSHGALAKVGRGWTKASSVFSNNIVAGASIAGIGYGLTKLAGSYMDAAKQQAELDLAWKKFPATANMNIEALRDYNLELMQLTGADDDALASTEAVIARFGMTGEQIKELIPLVNDLSMAKGVDLTAAAEMTGKAMMGQGRALKGVGIDFKSTGNAARDFANLQALLAEKVGGTAAQFGETDAGKVERLRQEYENLTEDLGQQLMPALDALVTVTEPVMGLFSALPDAAKASAVGFTVLGSAAMIATPRVIALNKALESRGGITGAARGAASALRGVNGILMGGLGVAVVAGGLALEKLSTDAQNTQARIDALKGSFDAATGAMNAAGTQTVTQQLTTDIDAGDWSTLGRLGLGLTSVTKGVTGTDDQFKELKASIEAVKGQDPFNLGQVYLLNTLSRNLDGMRTSVVGARLAQEEQAKEADIAARATGRLGDAHSWAAQKARDQAAAENDLTGAISAGQRMLQQRDAFRAYQEALDAYVKKPSKATGDAVDAAMLSWTSTFKKPERQQKAFSRGFDEIAAAVEKSGVSQQVKEYILKPLLEAEEAQNRILAASSPGANDVAMTRIYAKGMAEGGTVFGPGTGTSDTAGLFALSNREEVTRAAASRAMQRQFGPDVMTAINNFDRAPHRLLARFGAPRSSAPRIVVKAGTTQTMTTNVTASGQVDYELAQRRMARQVAREARARYAGSRS